MSVSRLDWNEAWGRALGADHELIEVLALACKHASMSGDVLIPAARADEWQDALTGAVTAGWLSALQWGADGTLTTRLMIPEGA